ncbi:hypothetical protein TNCV_4110891 [Trichonephila clavipes]|nr:hypothetical protein TNCV_4110891 [Trichonephila clavipes]
MKNCSRTLEQLALIASNTSQYVSRSGLGHIAIRTRMVNFKTHPMPLSSSMSTAKPSKNCYISPNAFPNQNSTRMVFFIPIMYGRLSPRGSDMLSNIHCINRSSRIVTGGKVRAAKHLPRKSYTCSMGLRSGDHAGQSIRSISSLSKSCSAATVR